MRIVKDSFGTIEVSDSSLWGAQTQRSLHFFDIGIETFPTEFIKALVTVKLAASRANAALGVLAIEKQAAIEQTAREILGGCYSDQFPLHVWQTGSGTQTNMNVNEVIATIASDIAPDIHPNDDVNRSQSTNDAFPTAMYIASYTMLHGKLIPEIKALISSLEELMKKAEGIVKIGRTHLQDATPLRMSDSFGAWKAALEDDLKHLFASSEGLTYLPIGGTAVGSGINAPEGYAQKVVQEISSISGYAFQEAPSKFAGLSFKSALVQTHGSLKALAMDCYKIANDVRLLASGPRCGIGEISLPENEPGSSIMPGKVNPTQAEALTMVCLQVFGNDTAISAAGSQGQFELNAYMPLLIFNMLQSLRLMTDSLRSFRLYCIDGIEIRSERVEELLERSLMLVTALTPVIGYDEASRIAKKAHKEDKTLRQVVEEEQIISLELFDQLIEAAKKI